MRGRLMFLAGATAGYVLGAKAGRGRYEQIKTQADSLWQGECFVFDQRVSLGHGLQPGRHGLCHACRRPLAPRLGAVEV